MARAAHEVVPVMEEKATKSTGRAAKSAADAREGRTANTAAGPASTPTGAATRRRQAGPYGASFDGRGPDGKRTKGLAF